MVSSGGGTIGGEHRAGGGRHGGARAGLSEVGPGGQGGSGDFQERGLETRTTGCHRSLSINILHGYSITNVFKYKIP